MALGLATFVHRAGPSQLDGTRDNASDAKEQTRPQIAPKHLPNLPGLQAFKKREAERAAGPQSPQSAHEQPVNARPVEPARDLFDASSYLETNSTIVTDHFMPPEAARGIRQQLRNPRPSYHNFIGHAADDNIPESELMIDDAMHTKIHQHEINEDYQNRHQAESHVGKRQPSHHRSVDHASAGDVPETESTANNATYMKNHQHELNGDYQNRRQAESHLGKPQPSYRRPAGQTLDDDVPEMEVTVDNAMYTNSHQHHLNGDHQNRQQAESHLGSDLIKRTVNGTTKKSKTRARQVGVEKLHVPEMAVLKLPHITDESHGDSTGRKGFPQQHIPVDTGAQVAERIPEPYNKRGRSELELDYPLATLYKMTFGTLQNEPYDTVLSTELPTLQDLLGELLEPSLTQQERHDILSSMSAEQWQQMGQELIERFARIAEKLIHSRHNRREIAKEYENEVARRHEEVVSNKEELARILEEMKEQGGQMMTPKSKKKGIFQA